MAVRTTPRPVTDVAVSQYGPCETCIERDSHFEDGVLSEFVIFTDERGRTLSHLVETCIRCETPRAMSHRVLADGQRQRHRP